MLKSYKSKEKPQQKLWFLCGAYNKLIQCYSLIQCNTCQYNVAFPNTLYRSHNQIVFLPAKHTVFRTILGRFSSECGAYNKLIQFYSLIQCNTYQYNASFFKVCIVQPHKVSFYPQTRRFRYNFRFKSCPLAKVHEVDTILQDSAMQQPYPAFVADSNVGCKILIINKN